MKPNGNSLTNGLSGKPANETAACGPGCDCSAASSNGKVKAAVCLVVLLAVAGIVAYKVFSGNQQDASNAIVGRKEAEGFTIAAPAQNATTEKESSAQDRGEPEKVAPSAKDDTRIGQYLDSLSELNKVALNQGAVFIFIPKGKDEAVQNQTSDAVLSAQKSLKRNNITVGLYTLATSSPDYVGITKQVETPAILVASKGRGMAAVSGEVTETKLLQAFMATSRAGGCGPSGCGPSSAGCK